MTSTMRHNGIRTPARNWTSCEFETIAVVIPAFPLIAQSTCLA